MSASTLNSKPKPYTPCKPLQRPIRPKLLNPKPQLLNPYSLDVFSSRSGTIFPEPRLAPTTSTLLPCGFRLVGLHASVIGCLDRVVATQPRASGLSFGSRLRYCIPSYNKAILYYLSLSSVILCDQSYGCMMIYIYIFIYLFIYLYNHI